MNGDKRDTVKELLQQIFDNVNHWLDFAEAKNAGLIAFNIALIAAVWGLDDDFIVLKSIIAVLAVISSICCMNSFLPKNKLDKEKLNLPAENPLEDNFLYFGDIAKYEKEAYLSKIFTEYCEVTDGNLADKLLIHYAEEIVINARIAVRKNNLFRLGAKIDIISLVVVVLFIMAA